MSLQGLISGAECAVPFNPLSQVLKHTEGDRSLQQVCPWFCQVTTGSMLNIYQDRIAGPSGSRVSTVKGGSLERPSHAF